MQYVIYNERVENKTMVAIPALGERKEIYKKLSEKLPSVRFICFDLPGHNSEQQDMAIETYLKKIDEILKKLNVNKYHLIGNSIGAWLIQAFYKQYPDSIQSLWLLDGGYYDDQNANEEQIILPKTESFEDIENAIKAMIAYTNALGNEDDKSFFFKYFVDNFVYEDGVYKHHANEVIVNKLVKEVDSQKFSSLAFHVPIFLCVASESFIQVMNKMYVYEFEKKHNIKSHIIPNSQHLLPLTNSGDVANLVLKYIELL